MAGKRRFGTAAADYVPSENDGEIWIRRFKDPSTQIRICPAADVSESGDKLFGTAAWPTAREHYDDGAGSFPCTEDDTCVGCNDTSERVQKRTRTYYINALDSKGVLRVFKLGSVLYKTFQGREQRMLAQDPTNLQPLSDRDYIINRMGKKLETTYDPEAGDKYPVDFPEEMHDIYQILEDRYDSAAAVYNGDEPVVRKRAEAEPEADEPEEKPAAKKTAAPAKKAAAKRAEPEPESEPDEPAAEIPKTPSEEWFDDADTAEIKGYLDRENVEYPARAPRSRLVRMAKEKAAEPPY